MGLIKYNYNKHEGGILHTAFNKSKAKALMGGNYIYLLLVTDRVPEIWVLGLGSVAEKWVLKRANWQKMKKSIVQLAIFRLISGTFLIRHYLY